MPDTETYPLIREEDLKCNEKADQEIQHSTKRKNRGRKRKRSTSTISDVIAKKNDTDHMKATLRAILGGGSGNKSMAGEAEIYTLMEFLHKCLPVLGNERLQQVAILMEADRSNLSHDDRRILCGMLFIPSKDFPSIRKPLSVAAATKSTTSCKTSTTENPYHHLLQVKMLQPCRQSLSSLVDDVVSTLVRRREQSNQQQVYFYNRKNNNVLCQGFRIMEHGSSSFSSYNSARQTFPMVMTHINNNVDYCKTSPIWLALHQAIGDDGLRCILLHTSIFLPVEANWDDVRGNFLQLTGPPLQPPSSLLESSSTTAFGRQTNRKKRKLFCVPPPLGPSALVPNRRSLFYSDAYMPAIGHGKRHILNKKNVSAGELIQDILRDILMEHPTAADTKRTCCPYEDCNLTARMDRWKRVLQNDLLLRSKSSSSSVRFAPALDICQHMLQRHKSFDYHRTLQRFCPVVVVAPTNDLAQLSTQGHSSHARVASWVCCIFRRVFSTQQWGGCDNERVVVEEMVPKYVSLRRDEHFCNKTLLQGIKVTRFRWLEPLASLSVPRTSATTENSKTTAADASLSSSKKSNKLSRGDHQRLQLLVLSFLRWVFSDFLTSLLRSVFYVTESEFSGKRVLYYRKPIWALFRNLSLQKMMQQRQYEAITESTVLDRLSHQQMGLSRLRLLPKTTGVRPIATLCRREVFPLGALKNPSTAPHEKKVPIMEVEEAAGKETNDPPPPWREQSHPGTTEQSNPSAAASSSRGGTSNVSRSSFQSRLSTNQVLSDAFSVLRYEHAKNEDSFGAGMDGLHYFFPRYRELMRELQPRQGPKKQLFFASVDIRRCYDNINQEHLVRVVSDLLLEDEYLLQRYSVLHPIESRGRVCKRRKQEVTPAEQFGPFFHTVRRLTTEYHRSIFVDGVTGATRKEQVMEQLREHLMSHLLVAKGRHGNRYLVQATGIPQGSVLSSLLCNFYYGNIERRLFGHDFTQLPSNDTTTSLLVRMIDDFLLVSTCCNRVKHFLSVMSQGVPDLGVEINSEKTKVNKEIHLTCEDGTSATVQPDVIEADSGCFFAWCGMLFDCSTGEVRVDYSRFLASGVETSLTFDRTRSIGKQLLVQMKAFVRPRCIPILFDSLINSRNTQIVNFYQLLVLAAVKTVEYLHCTDMVISLETNVPFLCNCIESTSMYAFNLTIDRLKKQSMASTVVLGFKRVLAAQLGWIAFFDVFCHVDELRCLLDPLKAKLSTGHEDHQKLHASIAVLVSSYFSGDANSR
jgi:hypothetical protein